MQELIIEEDHILSYGSNASIKSTISNATSLSFLAGNLKSLQIKREDLQFIKRLSEGSYGIVFLGRYRSSQVAIKV